MGIFRFQGSEEREVSEMISRIEQQQAEIERLQRLANLCRKHWNVTCGYTEDGREITWDVSDEAMENLEADLSNAIHLWCKEYFHGKRT